MKCFMVRWRISGALNRSRALSDSVAGHVAQCASCRRFYEQRRILAAGLASEGRDGVLAPGCLHTRIMAAVREPEAAPPADFASGYRLILAGAAVVSLLVLLGVIVSPTGGNRAHRSALSRTVPLSDVDGYRRVAAATVSEVSVTVASPMEAEMERLKSDVMSVSRHLMACME